MKAVKAMINYPWTAEEILHMISHTKLQVSRR